MASVAIIPFTVVYEGKDITSSIEPYLLEMTYEDTVEGESSSVDIVLDNTDKIWSNEWYPQKGDVIDCSIGDLKCGKFMIDECELSGLPHKVTIRALENMIDKPVRAKKSRSHNKKSIRQIAEAVAKANGLKLIGSGIPNIVIDHVSQRRETDLKFLRRVAYDFGIIFSVRDDKLVYTSLYDIDKSEAAFTLNITDLTQYSLKDKTSGVFKKAKVSYYVPKEGKTVDYVAEDINVVTVRNSDNVSYKLIQKPDTLVVKKRVENRQQAEAVAKSHLYRANSEQQGGTVDFPGRADAVAGVNFVLTGLGDAGSGIFNITKVRHSYSRGEEWMASATIKRVAVADKEQQKALPAPAKAPVKPLSQTKLKISPPPVVNLVNKDGVLYKQITPIIK